MQIGAGSQDSKQWLGSARNAACLPGLLLSEMFKTDREICQSVSLRSLNSLLVSYLGSSAPNHSLGTAYAHVNQLHLGACKVKNITETSTLALPTVSDRPCPVLCLVCPSSFLRHVYGAYRCRNQFMKKNG